MVRHERPAANSFDRRILAWSDPRRIATALRNDALRSRHRKSTPFRSAMTTINSHIRRAGRSLDEAQRAVLERAKQELRLQFGKAPSRRHAHA